jgi:hypothetical protein
MQPEVVTKTIHKAVALLKASGCQFKVITEDGEEFGGLEVVFKKSKTIRDGRTYFELSNHIKPHIGGSSKVGDVLEVPSGKYNPEHIRSALCAILTKRWGAGSYTTAITDKSVQVMRVH